MNDDANGAGETNVLLAAVLAGLVIVVAVLGFLMFNDHRAAIGTIAPSIGKA